MASYVLQSKSELNGSTLKDGIMMLTELAGITE